MPGSSTTSCSPCAAVDFTGGTPASGAETDPLSGRTMRIVPLFCVTSRAPFGRIANAQAPVSPPATVCTLIGAEGFAGGGASVWPAKAGFGSGGDWAPTPTAKAAAIAHSAPAHLSEIVMGR